MTRRLLAVLIALVGTSGVIVVVLATYFPTEDVFRIDQPGPVRRIEVTVESGDVSITGAAADTATVERTRRYLRGKPRTEEKVVGGTLQITAACATYVPVGCEVDYRVTVGADIPVQVRVERGSVSVAGMTGTVDVDTEAAGVRLTGTRGALRVTTSAGSVVGVDVVAQFLDATTGAGRIRLDVAEPPGRVGLRTGAGSVDVGLPPVAGGYRVAAKSGSGKVDVTVDEDPGGSRSIIVDTGAGRIHVHPR